jgi:hypothetical protein
MRRTQRGILEENRAAGEEEREERADEKNPLESGSPPS